MWNRPMSAKKEEYMAKDLEQNKKSYLALFYL